MTPPPEGLIVKQFWETTFVCRLWPEHAHESPGLISFLYDLRGGLTSGVASGIAPSAKSAAGLYESDFDLFRRDHPGLHKLKHFIGQTLQLAVAGVNGSEVDPRRIRIGVADSWFHITSDGGFHDAHGHNGCSWCGIYYLQTGDIASTPGAGAPNGGSRFYSPFATGGGYRDYGNKYLDRTYIDPPICDGMLLLFPSYLIHSGLPYRGKLDRIVLAFNAQATLVEPQPAP